MKKKKQQGFTLVELIVVMAIMGFLLIAIMNLLEPIKDVYKTSVTTKETSDAIEGAFEYADGQLKFCQYATVLKDYPGVPKVEDGYLVLDGVRQDNKYDKVIIIDSYDPSDPNTTRRGSNLSTYSPSSTATYRKGVQGSIMALDLNDTGGVIDFSQTSIVPANDFYGEQNFEIDVDYNIETEGINTRTYLSWNITAYTYSLREKDDSEDPSISFSAYNYDTVVQSYTRRFQLVNIDLKLDNKLIDFANGTASTILKAGGNYTPEASGSDFYDANNKYTYIFYKVPDVSKAGKYIVTLRYRTGAGGWMETPFEVQCNHTASSVALPGGMPIDFDIGSDHYTFNGKWTATSGIASWSGKTIEEIKSLTVDQDSVLLADYTITHLTNIFVDGNPCGCNIGDIFSMTEIEYNNKFPASAIDNEHYIESWTLYMPDGITPSGGLVITEENMQAVSNIQPKRKATFSYVNPSTGSTETDPVYFKPTERPTSTLSILIPGYIFDGWKIEETPGSWVNYDDYILTNNVPDNAVITGSFSPDGTVQTANYKIHVDPDDAAAGRQYRLEVYTDGNKLQSVNINSSDQGASSWGFNKTIPVTENEYDITATRDNSSHDYGRIKIYFKSASGSDLDSFESPDVNSFKEIWLYNETVYYDYTSYEMDKNGLPTADYQIIENRDDGEASIDGVRRDRLFVNYKIKADSKKTVYPKFQANFDGRVRVESSGSNVSNITVDVVGDEESGITTIIRWDFVPVVYDQYNPPCWNNNWENRIYFVSDDVPEDMEGISKLASPIMRYFRCYQLDSEGNESDIGWESY